MSKSTTLFIPESRKPMQPQVSDETVAKIRHQADDVLVKHRNDLPAHIVSLLCSPKIAIVAKTLKEDVAPWLKEHLAAKRLEAAKLYPKYEEAAALKRRADAVLESEFGARVKGSLDTRGQRILELDLFQILENEQLSGLRTTVKLAEASKSRLQAAKKRKDAAKPTEAPMSLEELFPPKERRERKPKAVKPAYTGLPPVRSDSTDTSFLVAKPYAVVANKDYVQARTQTGTPQRGKAVHNPKNHNKGKKQG